MITLSILYLLVLIGCYFSLKTMAKREMFESAPMLFCFILGAIVPIVNVIMLILYVVFICINIASEIEVYGSIDDYAKKLFKVKDTNDDANNFKGKGYR